MMMKLSDLNPKGIRKNMDIIAALGVIAIISLIILPINSGLLDILLTMNIALGIVILMLTMFTKTVLEFSVFPTLLLVTTLYRLGLNVSSTRLILTTGDAGKVIDAFGGFVTGSNYVVGAVIFLIITIIQLVVITNGAGRVSEVAARFTLDAMPGKQMSIDADLNAGMINEEDARTRRSNLQREADFYGAMDGASKFVKGDAIIGIVIVIINFVGGIIIFALQKDVPIMEAVQQFGMLTIGDGLVSQIPALLISTSSGILVTRSASSSSFGTELAQQLTSVPKVIGITACVLVALGLVPGLPTIPFLTLAFVLGIITYFLVEEAKQKVMDVVKEGENLQQQKQEQAATAAGKEPEDVSKYVHVEPLEIEIGYGLIPLAESGEGGDLLERIAAVRKQSASDLGIIIQPIRIRDNLQLNPDEYVIKIKNNEVGRGFVLCNHFLVMDPISNSVELEGVDTVEPAFGLPAKWVESKDKEDAEMLGYTIVEPTTVIVTHLSELIKNHSHELLGRQEVKKLIDMVSENYNAVVEELIPNMLTLGDVQKVLHNLLKERVPIKDIITILETLADYASTLRDTELLTEYVRNKLGRTITMGYLNQTGVLDIITIHPSVEQYIYENIQKSAIQGSFPAIDPEVNTKILDAIGTILQTTQAAKPVIIATPRIRIAFWHLIEMSFPQLGVLSLNEVPNSIDLEGIGMVNINDN